MSPITSAFQHKPFPFPLASPYEYICGMLRTIPFFWVPNPSSSHVDQMHKAVDAPELDSSYYRSLPLQYNHIHHMCSNRIPLPTAGGRWARWCGSSIKRSVEAGTIVNGIVSTRFIIPPQQGEASREEMIHVAVCCLLYKEYSDRTIQLLSLLRQ